MDKTVQDTFEGFIDGLANVQRVELPGVLSRAPDTLNIICDTELWQEFSTLYRESADQFSPQFREEYERGRQITGHDYLEALSTQALCRQSLDPILGDYDALVTPAALGEAPTGLGTTGDPIFCTTWTLTGHPANTFYAIEDDLLI